MTGSLACGSASVDSNTRAIHELRIEAVVDCGRMQVSPICAVIVSLLIGMSCTADRIGPESPTRSNPSDVGTVQPPSSRPNVITHVFPPDGLVAKSPELISVAFNLRGEPAVDFESVRLMLDELDVTDRARRAGTDDIPQSRGELIVEMEGTLAPGLHKVTVVYRGGERTYEYSWQFRVLPS
jgi:hypothetical protein